MAATAITNACVHSVQVLGNDLSFAYPHLKDLDHIIALLVCEDLLIDLVSDHDAKRGMDEELRPAAERDIIQRLKTTAAVAARLVDRVLAQYEAQSDLANLSWASRLALPGRHRIAFRDGPNWAEPDALASSVADLYHTFLANIMPVLMYYTQDLACLKLPHEANMKPLWELVQAYVTTKRVPLRQDRHLHETSDCSCDAPRDGVPGQRRRHPHPAAVPKEH
ncbi:hypothetical protein SDRG_11198 [Saprolegnia diclina VS20]|uniref:Uncharacterized protein n=1 Tax=Saprolegnia diclina (strain VS20) TaxID=1156394 RepID=T0Q8Q8_SAPDV|nr:hypothetical protein SDRG_11198 [Saprolegnia diclina VS20]EQC31011.1 hypothetical protein SDRG_11198 [Saprolegnia diclina VS20]|eukprot:XP_008615450.1 hypothetical protein SDRG_11198 [Saprolegnia diclina VS20]